MEDGLCVSGRTWVAYLPEAFQSPNRTQSWHTRVWNLPVSMRVFPVGWLMECQSVLVAT